MRRIVSFVWNDIRKIQKIGNRKKSSDQRDQDAAHDPFRGRACDPSTLLRPAPRARSRSLQPVLDEDVRQEVGDRPEDDQQRRRAADIGVLEEVEIGLDLEDQQRVAGPALRHRIDDVELLDGVEQAEQRRRDDVGHQHRQGDAEEDEAARHAVERRRLEGLLSAASAGRPAAGS